MNLEKLTLEQLEVAEKVIAEAKRQGVNPNFVLPLVMQESGFKQESTSKKGALGVMQLMPATAKGLGVDPSDLDENIRGGITYFKQQLENPAFAGDPNSAYIAYNAGPNAKFFKTGDPADIPLETLEYLEKIRNFSGGQLSGSAQVEPSVAVAELPPPADGADETQETGGDTQPRGQTLNPLIGAGLGAAAGTSAGTAAAVMKGKYDALTEAYDAVVNRGKGSHPATPPTGDTPGGKWGAKTGYGMGEGTVQESSSRYQRATPKGKVSGKLAKTWGPAMPGESPDVAQRMIDRASAAETAKLAQRAEAAAAATASKSSPLMAYAKRLSGMPLKGGLAGAGAGFGAIDAMNRYSQKDKTGAAISGLGTAAGLAAMAVPSMGVLPAMAVGAPLYLYARDRIEHLKKNPEQIQFTEDDFDAMGNYQRFNYQR